LRLLHTSLLRYRNDWAYPWCLSVGATGDGSRDAVRHFNEMAVHRAYDTPRTAVRFRWIGGRRGSWMAQRGRPWVVG
jgi:hypothetical protein